MKAGETNEFKTISGEVAEAIADRFQKIRKNQQAAKTSGTGTAGEKD